MSFLTRLFGNKPDPREPLRPLWLRVIDLARDPAWYATCGVADSVTGRFDVMCSVMSAVMIRLEASEMRAESAFLTEFFVADMDGQLREFGVNDVVVGKRMGKLMGLLGGRLGAYREPIAANDVEGLTAAVGRNVSFTDDGSAECAAQRMLELARRLSATSDEALLAGDIAA
jgi:cytochrome b pre-mRNA-processing protein 3